MVPRGVGVVRPVTAPTERPRGADAGDPWFESSLQSSRGSVPTSKSSEFNVPEGAAGSPFFADSSSGPHADRAPEGAADAGCRLHLPPAPPSLPRWARAGLRRCPPQAGVWWPRSPAGGPRPPSGCHPTHGGQGGSTLRGHFLHMGLWYLLWPRRSSSRVQLKERLPSV